MPGPAKNWSCRSPALRAPAKCVGTASRSCRRPPRRGSNCRCSVTECRGRATSREANSTTQPTDKGWKIAGNCVAVVPEGTRATMHLMWAHPEAIHPPAPKLADTSAGFQLTDDAGEKAALQQQAEKLRAVKPKCTATVNGKPVNVAMNDSKLYRPENVGDHRVYAEYPPAAWVWFQFDLPAGRSEVAVAIECPKGERPGPARGGRVVAVGGKSSPEGDAHADLQWPAAGHVAGTITPGGAARTAKADYSPSTRDRSLTAGAGHARLGPTLEGPNLEPSAPTRRFSDPKAPRGATITFPMLQIALRARDRGRPGNGIPIPPSRRA